jgi:hypothetical protein
MHYRGYSFIILKTFCFAKKIKNILSEMTLLKTTN